jgi:FtsH-binding integral membrane protein|mmetsp:Transcript_114458/g.180229  ORF Transcript_114458/g.180229 Transcript_114458/m.180229 type:complete len:281 (-) Transcript_114458:200-1042(-)
MASVEQATRKVAGAQKRSTTPTPKAHAGPSKGITSEAEGKGQDKSKAQLHGLTEGVNRAKFLRKVYGILTAQMLFTVSVAAACMYVQGIREALVRFSAQLSSSLRWAIIIPTLVSLLVLKCGAKDRYPWNYTFLSLFTVSTSINVGFVCAIFQEVGLGELVLQAFGMTTVIFLGLTAYTLYSGKDFGFLRAYLYMSLWGLTLIGVFRVFFPSLNNLLIAYFGALVFCGYILYDTSRLMKTLSYDDYILATIEIYLDIINLFFYILDILAKLQSKDKKDKK